MRKLSNDEYLQKARLKHGDRYDYSRVNYATAQTKIEIGCADHGWFLQKACAHLYYGCKKCGDSIGTFKRITPVEQFIDRANNKHKFKYSYEKTEFTSQHNLIEIICPIHGSFHQLANDHLKGRGCKKCGVEARSALRSVPGYSTQEFINRARQVHGDLFSYDRTIFNGCKEELTITCKKHGDFSQLPSNHLVGNGCKICAIENARLSFEEFVERANAIHCNEYVYKSENYSGLRDKVGIECQEHGLFWQTGTDHIHSECRCPFCAVASQTRQQNCWLDVMNVEQREVWLSIGNKRIKADGFDPVTKTVYEFWGDFWHGNPRVFNQDDLNAVTNTTYGFLYSRTLNKRKLILEHGYKLIEIWENDWREINGRQRRIYAKQSKKISR